MIPTDNMYYNVLYVYILISNYYTKSDTNNKYQAKFTVLTPLNNSSTNVLSIDLTSYYNKS